MRPLFTTTLVLHMAACFLVPTGLGLDGLVLCIADQGHVAIERPGHGCCDERDDSLQEAAAIGHDLHEEVEGHCGHCTDIPLPPGDKGPLIPLSQRPAKDVLSAMPALYAAVLPEAPSVEEARIDQRLSCAPRSLACLRTVVLLL